MATVSQIVELRGLCFHTLFGAAPPLKGSHSLCVTALGLRLGQKSRECGVLQEFNERSDWNTLSLKKTTGANQGNKERQKRNNDERGEVWGRGRWYCIANEEQERRCAQPLRSISANIQEGQLHTVKPHDLEEPQRRRLWTLQKPQKEAEEEEKSVCFSVQTIREGSCTDTCSHLTCASWTCWGSWPSARSHTDTSPPPAPPWSILAHEVSCVSW